MKEPESF